MFEDPFRTSKTIEKYQGAPLAQDCLRYLRHCAESGVRPQELAKIASVQLNLVRLLDLQEAGKVTVSQVGLATREWSWPGVHWYGRSASPLATTIFAGQALRWLRFLDRCYNSIYSVGGVPEFPGMRRARIAGKSVYCGKLRTGSFLSSGGISKQGFWRGSRRLPMPSRGWPGAWRAAAPLQAILLPGSPATLPALPAKTVPRITLHATPPRVATWRPRAVRRSTSRGRTRDGRAHAHN